MALLASLLFGCSGGTPGEPGSAPYGADCATNGDCASDVCLFVAEPFCTTVCSDDCGCPSGATCTLASADFSVCAPGENTCARLPDASVDATLDTALDTAVAMDSGSMMSGGEPGDPCATSDDCDAVTSFGGTGPRAERMVVPQQCATWVPGGLCSMTACVENFRRDPCPAGTECVNFTGGSVCLVDCDGASDCRDGWACRGDVDPGGPLCWLSCATTGCGAGLTCQPDGTCSEDVVAPVDYVVTERALSLGAALTPVDAMTSGGDNMAFTLPFDVRFFSETYRAGTDVVASWQGLFAFDRTGIMAFAPGNRTRYESAAPLVVAHHYENARSADSTVSHRVSGAAPSRRLEVEWVSGNLSGSGGARFRLRFDEGSDSFVVHYGSITADVIGGSWTQLAMLDTAQFEEVVVPSGSPAPETRANTEYTYTPR